MSDDKCPRCGHASSPSNIGHPCEVVHWNCGTYREPSGNIYESELCEARQELKIQREIATQFEAGAALLILRAEKAEAELKKLQNTYNGMRARHSLEMSVIEAFLFDDRDEDGELNGLPNQWYDYDTVVADKAQMVVIERNKLREELADAKSELESERVMKAALHEECRGLVEELRKTRYKGGRNEL